MQYEHGTFMSPSIRHASAVYADELAYLKEGHAIWIPEGPNDSAEVQLGDVGYINAYGAFIFLFSVDKRNENIAGRRMAKYPRLAECLYFNFEDTLSSDTIITYDKYMQPEVYKSRTVKTKQFGETAGG